MTSPASVELRSKVPLVTLNEPQLAAAGRLVNAYRAAQAAESTRPSDGSPSAEVLAATFETIEARKHLQALCYRSGRAATWVTACAIVYATLDADQVQP